MAQGKINRISRVTIFPLLRKLFKFSYSGLENISKSKNYIFAMNHQSALDPLLAASILVPHTNRHLSIFLHKNFFKIPLVNILFWRWQAIKVDRSDPGKINEAIGEGVRLLGKGNNLIIFPEGEVHGGPLNEPLRAYTSVIRLAIKARKTIIPVGITGSYYAWKFPHTFPKNPLSLFSFSFKAPISIKFGNEINFRKYRSINLNERTEENRFLLRKLTTQLMAKIAKLAGQEYVHDREYLKR